MRRSVADRLVTPWWYHPILGLLLGGHTVVLAFGGTVARVISLVVLLACLWLLMLSYRRLTGLWVSGYESGPAGAWTIAMGVVAGAGCATAILIAAFDGPDVWVWIIAAMIVIAVVMTGRGYDRSLRARLREQ